MTYRELIYELTTTEDLLAPSIRAMITAFLYNNPYNESVVNINTALLNLASNPANLFNKHILLHAIYKAASREDLL